MANQSGRGEHTISLAGVVGMAKMGLANNGICEVGELPTPASAGLPTDGHGFQGTSYRAIALPAA